MELGSSSSISTFVLRAGLTEMCGLCPGSLMKEERLWDSAIHGPYGIYNSRLEGKRVLGSLMWSQMKFLRGDRMKAVYLDPAMLVIMLDSGGDWCLKPGDLATEPCWQPALYPRYKII